MATAVPRGIPPIRRLTGHAWTSICTDAEREKGNEEGLERDSVKQHIRGYCDALLSW